MVKVLSDERRWQMVIRAVTPGANIENLAAEHGIHRNALHKHVNRAVRDPEGQWRDAEAEASFGRKAYEMTR